MTVTLSLLSRSTKSLLAAPFTRLYKALRILKGATRLLRRPSEVSRKCLGSVSEVSRTRLLRRPSEERRDEEEREHAWRESGRYGEIWGDMGRSGEMWRGSTPGAICRTCGTHGPAAECGRTCSPRHEGRGHDGRGHDGRGHCPKRESFPRAVVPYAAAIYVAARREEGRKHACVAKRGEDGDASARRRAARQPQQRQRDLISR